PTTYLVDTTLSNSSDSDQTVQAVRLPFLVEPIFPSAYCFVVYVCRHDSKNGEDGSVCATPIFLSPDW
ncbi:hypothetical protein QVM76_18870, partial [Escherichia coli]|uniref:hypothetical protein n=1 Tax=Escherichia coli TaxID=562 RepID=UPI0035266A00